MNLENYKALLKLQGADFVKVDHEEAMVAEVYKVTPRSGQSFILKICDRENDYLREVYFLKLFKGIIPVPEIIETIPPHLDHHAAILMECVPGSLLKAADLKEALAYEIGKSLALIHQHRLQGYGGLIQGHLSPDPRPYFSLKFQEGLEECRGHLPNELINRCEQYFNDHVDRLLDADGPSVVHRDFRPGNLIVDEGKLKGIIDWASARASFAEEDLFSLEHGEWPIHSDYKNAFLSGYASIRKVPDLKPLLPLLRLNKAVATIGFTVKIGTWDSKHSSLYQYNRQFLDELIGE